MAIRNRRISVPSKPTKSLMTNSDGTTLASAPTANAASRLTQKTGSRTEQLTSFMKYISASKSAVPVHRTSFRDKEVYGVSDTHRC
jgi:hypothetical protein